MAAGINVAQGRSPAARLMGQHPGRQRQMAAQAGNLTHRGSLQAGAAGQAG